MLFATNRVLKEGPTPLQTNTQPRFPRSVSFDLHNNQAEQSIYFCRRHGENDYSEIGHDAFFDAINAEQSVKEILFYIHGFSSLPENKIFQRTEELQQHFDALQPNKIKVIPLIWPCDNDPGILKDYFDDRIAADASDIAFMRFFKFYLEWFNSHNSLPEPNELFRKNISILTHSMGARVLRGALHRSVQYFYKTGFPLIFRNIFISASDLVNESLEHDQLGVWIPLAARNVVVYYASDDWALRSSVVADLVTRMASSKLGQKGPEDFSEIPNNVFALDCGDFNNLYDPMIGHGYFAGDRDGKPGLVLRHMQATMQKGRVIMPAGLRDSILSEALLEPNTNTN